MECGKIALVSQGEKRRSIMIVEVSPDLRPLKSHENAQQGINKKVSQESVLRSANGVEITK
jgi:hypothetical protein